jgi:hypothetical protein
MLLEPIVESSVVPSGGRDRRPTKVFTIIFLRRSVVVVKIASWTINTTHIMARQGPAGPTTIVEI